MQGEIMDKSGWTYKKINEVCDKASSSIVLNKIENNTGDYPLYGASGFVKGIDFYHMDKEYIGIVKDGSGVGRVNIYPPKTSLVGTMQYILPHEDVLTPYVSYCLQSIHLDKYVHGAAIPHIYFKDYGKELIPVPPKETQQRIVSELDEINSAISLLQEQVKDLDALAQSTFYDMFGDPVENEKGWVKEPLKNVATLLNGRAYNQPELLSSGKYLILRVGNFFTNSNYYYSDLELDEDKYCDKGDLLIAWSATLGAQIWNGGKVIYHYHIWKVILDEMRCDKVFMCHYFNLITNFLHNDMHGIGMMHLTKSGMEKTEFIIPPLSLQQSFASKVSAMEEAKAELNVQIKETQTLLASRMQYWFD